MRIGFQGCNGPLCVSGIVCLLVSDPYKGDVCGFETVCVCQCDEIKSVMYRSKFVT